MISGQSFVYFGPEAWDSMWRNRHHLLTRLATHNRVVYVEPRPYVEQVTRGELRGRQTGGPGSSLERRDNGVWVYRPPAYAPLGGPPPLRAATHLIRRLHLNAALRRIDARHPLLWLSTPTQSDARADIPASLRVYHIVDEYLAYHNLPAERRASFARREQDLIRWADLVVVASPALLETKGRGNPKFRLLTNAVDTAAYNGPQPAMLPALGNIPRPILGYLGLISVRLDLALLDDLAAAHPEWSLVLMGTVYRSGCGDLLDRLASRPNVHFLEPVPGTEVASFVRWLDAGLAPYRVTDETVHASPLKIYEYLAAGIPVVAAPVPGALQFGGLVLTAATPEEYEGVIAAALAAECRAPELVAARRAAVAHHSWDARVETLSDMLTEALRRTPVQTVSS